MKPKEMEDPHTFLLRVEQKRLKYGYDEKECFRAFRSVLPWSYWTKLDEMREFAAIVDEDAEVEINWNTLIRRANHATKTTRLGPSSQNRVIAGMERTGIKIPPKGVAMAVPQRPSMGVCDEGCFAYK